MKTFKPLHFLAEDNRLHTLVFLPDVEMCETNICNDCSMYGYCINHEYDGEDFCLCDAVAHKMGYEFVIGEDLFRFERTEYDRSLQDEPINVMPRYPMAKKYTEPKYIV